MATARSKEAICRIVDDRILELETKGGTKPVFSGVVVTKDMLMVTNYYENNLHLYSLRDGKLMSSHKLEYPPMDLCLISKTKVAVCLRNRKIVILSFKSIDDVKLVKTFDVCTSFYKCHSVAKLNTEKLLISGEEFNYGLLIWGVLSITDGCFDSPHTICKGYLLNSITHLAIKDNTIYISCWNEDIAYNRGVYAYDICNPHKCKFRYQHQELNKPWTIMAGMDSVFVSNLNSNRIHQLTASGQLVDIHTVSSSVYGIFYDDHHKVLYTTSFESNKINVYKMENLHQPGVPVEILKMDDRSIQLFEDALKDGKETVHSIRIMVVGHMGVGKTTLVKRLLGEEVNISERRSTEGIDIYVNCCDVSLSTHEWTRRTKDSEQDYNLQRLVRVLTQNYQKGDSVADQEQVESSFQQERSDCSPVGIGVDHDKNTELLYSDSPQQNIGHNLSSTANLQEELPSTVDQRNSIQSENNTVLGREPGESNATESHKTDPLREMLKLLKENPDKAKQDVRKYAHLTIWDFAGQYAFYTTHQMFLTRRAIYLMVSDVSGQSTDMVEDESYFDTEGKIKCKVHEFVEIWMNSIHTCAPIDKEDVKSTNSPTSSYSVIPPPVILVGTHVDQIMQRQSVINASEECKQPLTLQAEIVNSTITPKPAHSGEHLTSSISQESLHTFDARLQRKRRATEQDSSISIQKEVTCADPKLLYQVLHNSKQGDLSSRTTLERNCQTVGLKFHGETTGNGNCFFEAVSSQIQRLNCPIQLSPQNLRQDAVAFLKANRVIQVSSGNINFAEFMCNESFEDYCARMAKDGEWADHVMVVAMARKLQRDILIVTSSPSSGPDDIIAWVVGETNFKGDPILLGHIWEHHYESLEPIDSSGLKVKDRRQDVKNMDFDENDTKNQMSMFGNNGCHFVVNSFSDDNIPGPQHPVMYYAEHSLDTDDPLDANEYSLDIDDCSEDSIDSYCHELHCRALGVAYLAELRSYLRDKPTIIHLVDKDFAIDNTFVDSELENLKMKIIEVASQQSYWGEQIPTRWFLLEQQLMKLRDAGVKVVHRSTVDELNKAGTVQIKESEELDLFLNYLHEKGTIIYINIEVLRDNIVLDPKCLIDALKLLISAYPENHAENYPQLNSPAGNDADNGSQSNSPADIAITQKWCDFKDKGILSPELVDVIWAKAKHPQLHANKDHILMVMEQLHVIAKPRSFSEIGEKVEKYFLTPCTLRQEFPREVIYPEQDQRMVSTSVLCYIFKEKYLPPPIFHRLIAACVTRWPVAKKKETSEYLIYCGCCVFDIDLFHRLTLHCRNHIIFARITRMVIDEAKNPDPKLCTRVRKFITFNLSKIISYVGRNLQYRLSIQCPPSECVSDDDMVGFSPYIDMWISDEGHAPDAPIKPEHMNHARLCVALVTVCGDAMRKVLRTHVPAPHTNIYQAILAEKGNLTSSHRKTLLNPDQVRLVFPDPHGQKTGTLDHFDLSLLYTLIRNVSTVKAPKTSWGNYPQDQPVRDTSLGASVERIRSYRNHISGHSSDGKINQQDLEDYWKKFEAVIHDIEAVVGGHESSQGLEKQKRQVISIYEAC